MISLSTTSCLIQVVSSCIISLVYHPHIVSRCCLLHNLIPGIEIFGKTHLYRHNKSKICLFYYQFGTCCFPSSVNHSKHYVFATTISLAGVSRRVQYSVWSREVFSLCSHLYVSSTQSYLWWLLRLNGNFKGPLQSHCFHHELNKYCVKFCPWNPLNSTRCTSRTNICCWLKGAVRKTH